MDFLSEYTRKIPPEVGRKYWRALLQEGTLTYEELMADDSAESNVESIVVAQEKLLE
jgi:hypothetical protein